MRQKATTKPVDEKLYFAKATMPANGWRGSWQTYLEACASAKRFIAQWGENGITARATVFYRDGKCCVEFGGDSEPDADLNRAEHDDRGDN